MEKIILVKPDLSYADEIIKYKEESLAEIVKTLFLKDLFLHQHI